MIIRKLAHTLMFWQSVGTAKVDGQDIEVGMGINGGAIFIIVPKEAWYVVDIGEVVKALVEYRIAHKDDLPDDEPKKEAETVPAEGGGS